MAIVNDPNTEYVLSLSYGKDSIACLEACKVLGWRIDRVVHAEVWATKDIPADLPPMVEFKKYADGIIKKRYGLTVEHIDAGTNYNELFYRKLSAKNFEKRKAKIKSGEYKMITDSGIYGFPSRNGAWCNSMLKMAAINKAKNNSGNNSVSIIGIAADESERIARHSVKSNILLPLVELGWDEAFCRRWCEENDLLSPTYTTSARGGCWFCHNQSLGQLRLLRKNYPELWQILLAWDIDSPINFKANGHTVHDYDRRFAAEDAGIILPNDPKFRWSDIDGDVQLKLFL